MTQDLESMTERSSYRHEKLPDAASHIRLLKIEPAEWNDPIRLTVGSHELKTTSSPSPFFAISYTWGFPAPAEYIVIDGDRTFAVRPNCAYALRQYRLHHSKEPVWIDGICINQDDSDEKSKQVQMMGRIYSTAQSIVACLGSHQDDSEFVMQAIQSKCYRADNGGEMERLGKAYAEFGSRQYWNRLWIVQEIRLAREIFILCDTDVVCSWEEMRRWHYRCPVKFQIWRERATSLHRHLSLNHHVKSQGLLENIRMYKDFGCTEPRDHVFALLGISTEQVKIKYTGLIISVILDVLEASGLRPGSGLSEQTKLRDGILELADILRVRSEELSRPLCPVVETDFSSVVRDLQSMDYSPTIIAEVSRKVGKAPGDCTGPSFAHNREDSALWSLSSASPPSSDANPYSIESTLPSFKLSSYSFGDRFSSFGYSSDVEWSRVPFAQCPCIPLDTDDHGRLTTRFDGFDSERRPSIPTRSSSAFRNLSHISEQARARLCKVFHQSSQVVAIMYGDIEAGDLLITSGELTKFLGHCAFSGLPYGLAIRHYRDQVYRIVGIGSFDDRFLNEWSLRTTRPAMLAVRKENINWCVAARGYAEERQDLQHGQFCDVRNIVHVSRGLRRHWRNVARSTASTRSTASAVTEFDDFARENPILRLPTEDTFCNEFLRCVAASSPVSSFVYFFQSCGQNQKRTQLKSPTACHRLNFHSEFGDDDSDGGVQVYIETQEERERWETIRRGQNIAYKA